MLSSISHDLRTPLAALRASVEAIRDGVADDPDAYLRGWSIKSPHSAHLVDDLSCTPVRPAAPSTLRRTRVDLTEVADEAIETMRPLAPTTPSRCGSCARSSGGARRFSATVSGGPQPARQRDPPRAARHRGPTTVELAVTADDTSAQLVVSDNGPAFAAGLNTRLRAVHPEAIPAR